MRFIVLILMIPNSAYAWEFTAGLPCRLTHQTSEVSLELTYDPTQPLYSISLTKTQAWPQAGIFEMRFDGPASLAISTERHALGASGTRLTVTDTGFGNVLDGLQFNHTARVILGNVTVEIPLIGAADPVDAFRRCEVSAGA
ncbi:MAG: hypothetical protein R8G34_09160 [Paracoccaceae bacterium]|nr:hypothetical protein [Paracoccaceae bacterium]